ncbi:hypothetical protein V7S79_11120 [Aquirufa sp. ROCK-SH2]
MKNLLNQAIEQGISYLEDHQLPNGEFLFYMSGDDAMQSWNLPESTVFPSAQIGNCLLGLKKRDKVGQILLNTANFLKYQMDRGGLWNHYTLLHRWRNVCPNDLDDTACVSGFLKSMNFNFPLERSHQLILDNRRRDGLFYTWITFRFQPNKNLVYWYYVLKELKQPFKSLIFWWKFECSRYGVDGVVNANILYYLGKRKETDAIIHHLVHIIKENMEDDCDYWYRSPLVIYYFISRNIPAGINELKEIQPDLTNRILSKKLKNGSFGESELETAFAISSLIYLDYHGPEVENGINYLIKTQSKGGNWKRWAFYYSGPQKHVCWGSEELTTAFCLEALALYENLLSNKKSE